MKERSAKPASCTPVIVSVNRPVGFWQAGSSYEGHMAARSFLYVEDDDASFVLLQMVLREADPTIQLSRASDGEQAIAMLQNRPPYQSEPRPDLILLDLNLPKKNGLEVLQVVKQDESLRLIPVIMFTTSASRPDREASFALGADRYMTKPRTLELLIDAVKTLATESGPRPTS
jgi:chemotaxis family two-component system response regulator Rcp1